jgi:hypothetical protein
MEIDNHRTRIDELEKMIQSLGNLLYHKQEPQMQQDETVLDYTDL